MKKVVIQMVAAVVCVFLVSCGGGSGSSGGGSTGKSVSSGPSGVAEKAFGAWVKGDAKAFLDYFDLEEMSAKEKDEGVEFIKAMIQWQPITKYEIQEEIISEDGKKAKVQVKFYAKDGEVNDSKVPFVKTGKGWKIDGIVW